MSTCSAEANPFCSLSSVADEGLGLSTTRHHGQGKVQVGSHAGVTSTEGYRCSPRLPLQIGRRPTSLDVSTAPSLPQTVAGTSANGRQLPIATVRQSEADGVRAFRYCRVGTGFAYIARRPRTAEKKLAFMKVRRRGGTKPCSQRLTFILLLQFDPKGQWALTPLAKTFCGQ